MLLLIVPQSLVKTERECPYDMREAVCTLIWAANRTDIQELVEVRIH
jgi:vacuolar protein sorting-associated protein IST1